MAEQRFAQGLGIDPDLQIGGQHRDPRQHHPLQPVEHQRQIVDQGGNLFFEQWQKHKDEGDAAEEHQCKDHRNGCSARSTPGLNPIHQRVAEVGQERRDHERRQDRR